MPDLRRGPGPETIQITASYRVKINPDLPDITAVELPIFLPAPIEFQPGVTGTGGSLPSQADLVAMLNTGVVVWFENNHPVPNGDLVFDLTVMSGMTAVGAPPMPLLRLEDLVLHYRDWLNPPS